DMRRIWKDVKGAQVLDYVSCWYRKAAEYCEGSGVRCAFVSTNSITQGEQNCVLWSKLRELGVKINFAHRTFTWTSEARGMAHVHVVIIGFSMIERGDSSLYEYGDSTSPPHKVKVKRINSYLVDGPDVCIIKRKTPISAGVPEINYGSFALDGGHFTLDKDERDLLIAENRRSAKYLRPFLGGKELINNLTRWCIWLHREDPSGWRNIEPIRKRVENVRKWRQKRYRATTKALAKVPALFAEIRQPSERFLAVPTLSSVQRMYIPMAFLEPGIIASNQLYIIEGASLFHFGVLTSSMHMAWVRATSGRFKSDYRYSAKIVYNNFPWPVDVSAKHRDVVVSAAQGVLDARAALSGSLADQYDDLTMDVTLRKAHA